MGFDIKHIVTKNKLVTGIILIASFLRLYKLPEFITFLGDQGRDAIIIKRIVTFEHFPAIGAPTSVGQIFLGPFYYYLMAFFLWLSHFNPVGMAYGVAAISIAGLIISYIIIRKEIGKKIAFIFLVFLAFSWASIEPARFSWNPNLLPLFSFITFYFFFKAIKTGNNIFWFLFGSLFALSIQLHYLALLIGLPMGIIIVRLLMQEKNKMHVVKKITVAAAAFVLFSSPLIIFDLKHNFINSKSFVQLFTKEKVIVQTSYLTKLLETNQSFINFVLNAQLPRWITTTVFLFILMMSYGLIRSKKTPFYMKLHIFVFVLYIFAFAQINSWRYYHYYGAIYYSFFLMLAYGFSLWNLNNRLKTTIIGTLLLIYIILNGSHYTFLTDKGNNQITIAQNIAKSISTHITSYPYQVVAIPSTETDGHIRYYLELYNKKPLPDNAIEQGKELFVMCYEKKCSVLGNAQWQIASFQNAKIDTMWQIYQIKIYKLVHGT